MPAKIMRHIWAALKKLDTIVPGVLHLSTIMYYPEIKMYANKPVFRPSLPGERQRLHGRRRRRHLAGGITGAWRAASGRRRDTGRELTQGGPAVPIAAKYPKSSSSYSRDTVSRPPPSGSSSGRCGNAGRKRR